MQTLKDAIAAFAQAEDPTGAHTMLLYAIEEHLADTGHWGDPCAALTELIREGKLRLGMRKDELGFHLVPPIPLDTPIP